MQVDSPKIFQVIGTYIASLLQTISNTKKFSEPVRSGEQFLRTDSWKPSTGRRKTWSNFRGTKSIRYAIYQRHAQYRGETII